MSLTDALTFATVAAYLASGLVGWAVCLAARRSRRYYPAMSFAGTGFGLLPTYTALLLILRRYGAIDAVPDTWQRVTSFLVCVAVVALGLAALGYVASARRDEAREERMRAAAGC